MKRIENSEKRISDPILREGIGSLPERIREAMGEESNRQFAKNIGVSESNLRTLLKGAIPKLDTLLAIASYTGMDFNYLATGVSSEEAAKEFVNHHSKDLKDIDVVVYRDTDTSAEEDKSTLIHYSSKDFEEDYALIEGYHSQVSTGHGSLWNNEEVKRHLAFRTKWLKYRGLRARDLRVVFATGDSMEPTIHSGDSLLVDIGSSDYGGGAIYVIRMGGHLYAKRIEIRVDGGVDIISENKAYPVQTIFEGELEAQLFIVGKVVWVGKDISL